MVLSQILLEACQTDIYATMKIERPRVAFQDLGSKFQQEALSTSLRHLKTGRHRVAVDAGRDEAIAPKQGQVVASGAAAEDIVVSVA